MWNNEPSDFLYVIEELDKKIGGMLQNQVTDTSRPDYGGYFMPQYGFASPSHIGNASFLMYLGFGYFSPESRYGGDPDILQRMLIAAQFQQRCQRESGLIDIPFTNFDSPPDTAFSISQLAYVAWMARHAEGTEAQAVENALKPYLLSAAKAVAEDGFHTPNHRWAVVQALAQVRELYPQDWIDSAIDAYFNEGIDINEDGMYSERSTGGYNANCNRHLIVAAEALAKPELLEPVRRNLVSTVELMHDDFSIVTSISLRQDKGKVIVPVKAIDGFYYMARMEDNDAFCAVAKNLAALGGWSNETLIYLFARHPEWKQTNLKQGDLPDKYIKHMKDTGIWRARDGKLSATLTTDSSGAFAVKYGKVELASIRLFAPYFAGAKFIGKTIAAESNKATLVLESEFLLPQLPGYWLPLGRPVAFAELPFKQLDERKVKERPKFRFYLDVEAVDEGFDLGVRTEGGLERVPFILELLYRPQGGRIETEQASFAAAAGQTLLMKSGYLTYRVEDEAITVGPGFYGNRLEDAPGTEGAGEFYRVAMTDWTPVERKFSIRCGRWSEAEGTCISGRGPGAGFSSKE